MSIVKIWSDKKRMLGLPISFTTYSLSEDRLFIDSGFLKFNLSMNHSLKSLRIDFLILMFTF